MKLRRRIIRLHVALEAARRHYERNDAAFWADPMTAHCGCAGELAADQWSEFRNRQKARFTAAFRPLGRGIFADAVFAAAERMCGRTVRDSLMSAWLGEG